MAAKKISLAITGMNYTLEYIKYIILNGNNISQYYYFEQINAALLRLRI